MQVGQIKKFNFAKGKSFEVKEIIEDVNEPLDWEWSLGKCPHCDKEIKKPSHYNIGKVEILENEDGDIEMIGYTKELIQGQPLTLRLPNNKFFSDKSMEEKIKTKSDFMKEKENGK